MVSTLGETSWIWRYNQDVYIFKFFKFIIVSINTNNIKIFAYYRLLSSQAHKFVNVISTILSFHEMFKHNVETLAGDVNTSLLENNFSISIYWINVDIFKWLMVPLHLNKLIVMWIIDSHQYFELTICNIHNKSQLGCQEDLFTSNVILELISCFHNKWFSDKKCVIAFIDVVKAFENVDHSNLMNILYKTDIRGVALELIKIYPVENNASN